MRDIIDKNKGWDKMNVFDTSSWVIRHHYYKKAIGESFAQLFNQDRTKSQDEWLSFLVDQGMIPISEGTKNNWLRWRRQLKIMEHTRFIKKLQDVFSGPDIDLYLFPLNRDHKKIMNDLDGKNGCSFKTYVLLFWKDDLPLIKQKALLLHEYHHIARLYHQGENERTIPLLESMIMEGVAEWEVEKRLGKDHLAPWTSMYSEEEMIKWWNRLYKGRLQLRGRTFHHPYLFGDLDGIPPMMGYQIGYYLVSQFMNKHSDQDSLSVLKTPAHQFLREDLV